MADADPNASSVSAASAAAAEEAKVQRRARSERLNYIMWAYVCGAITWLSYVVGYERSFIPLMFGVLGGLIDLRLVRTGDRRHGIAAGAVTLGGLMVWATYNWPVLQGYLASH